MSEKDGIDRTSGQPAEELASVKETDAGPDRNPSESMWDLNPESQLSAESSDSPSVPAAPPTPESGSPPDPEDFPLHPAPSLPLPPSPSQPVAVDSGPSPLFQSWSRPEILPAPRIPHLGHLLVLAVLALFGWVGAGLLTASALHFHLFGISTLKQAESDIHYTLFSMAALYVIPFAAGLFVFPVLWHKSFLAGLQWNAATAFRLRGRLFGAACACFVLAMIDGLLLPGPSETPIDKIFRTPGAAWLLFGFGVTFAPFFEEIVFRGFLLPALCTAYDWAAEMTAGEPAPPLDLNGQPQWSIPAMVVASILVSIPFALMHAEQTAGALGPFLLLVCVSLVLCWARLSTRSLAASVLVHASYNLLLFSLMLLGTGGFKHLDKM
jgi:membrane protease YdiL (CAAX protease family)